ncbi:AAA family ATPase [Solidesulfovibrio sp.]
MPEKLLIQNVGPIPNFEIQPNNLTILIGPQASGKSLFAQLLYFFRGIDFFLANDFNPTITGENKWEELVLKRILDDVRGVPFGYFANGVAKLVYSNSQKNNSPLKLNIYNSNRRVRPLQNLLDSVRGWYDEWDSDKKKLRSALRKTQIFIPTERSLYTQLAGKRDSVLFSDSQPLTVREFAETLTQGQDLYKSYYAHIKKFPKIIDRRTQYKIFSYVLDRQRQALAGEAYIPTVGPREWKWRIETGGKSKPLPIQATASGQMEAWPFFVIAATFCATNGTPYDIYFEEPETHLHPRAQLEVVKTICYLVSRGTRFVVTTHSPYVLYLVNNYMQKHIAYNGTPPDDEVALNPDLVSAYCLGENPKSIVNSSTKLLDLTELEGVFDDIGREFDRYIELEMQRDV